MDIRNLKEQVYDEIRLDILSGRLAQGQRVSATDLAKRFNISSQPVRDAIIRLTEEGLIYVRPRRGTFVTTINPDRVVELNSAREMIETFSLNHINLSLIGGSSTWNMLTLALTEMDRVVSQNRYDYLEYNRWDYQFHLGLVMLGQNNTITAIYQKLHPHSLYSMVMYQYASTMHGNHQDHAEIIEYLRNRQIEEAQHLCIRHIQQATAKLLELMGVEHVEDRIHRPDTGYSPAENFE